MGDYLSCCYTIGCVGVSVGFKPYCPYIMNEIAYRDYQFLHRIDGDYDSRRFCIGGKMENLIGKVTASLIEKEQSFPDELIDKINDNVKPPEAINPDDIYVRAMYLLSDQVNSYGGKFPVEEHDNVIELLIDCPVLIGHRKDSLPIARTFYAEKEQRDGGNWVKVYFYWLKNSDKGEDLRKNIDGGIYKECSISFIFSFPECSICGSDIRDCRHRPFKKYDTKGGARQEAYFNYRQVEKVLEVSLVYRGSVHNTSITRELFVPHIIEAEAVKSGREYRKSKLYRIWDLKCLDTKKEYFVQPAYESLDVVFEKTGDDMKLSDSKNNPISCEPVLKYLKSVNWPDGEYALDCRLIGYRGKSRQPVHQIISLLNDADTTVKRIEIKIYDLLYYDGQAAPETFMKRRLILENIFDDNPKLLVPSEKVNGRNIEGIISHRGTRLGYEIIDETSLVRYLYTRSKLLPLYVCKKCLDDKKPRYGLYGYSDNEHLQVTAYINSELKLNEGDLVEVEVYSVCRDGNGLKLVNPKVVDTYSYRQNRIDIANLLKSTESELSSPMYTVYEKSGGGIVLRLDNNSNCQLLCNYSPGMIEKARRLLVESINIEGAADLAVYGSGIIVGKKIHGETAIYHLSGFFDGRYAMKPVLLNETKRLIFYQINDGDTRAGCHEV